MDKISLFDSSEWLDIAKTHLNIDDIARIEIALSKKVCLVYFFI